MTFNHHPAARISDAAADFAARRQREQRYTFARRPKKIADVVAQLLTKRGYGRIDANEQLNSAWSAAAGEPLASASRPGKLRRGTLEIWVTNSTVMQEFSFAKDRILAELTRTMPDAKIRGLKFRVGTIQ